jgi:hypothetical protein
MPRKFQPRPPKLRTLSPKQIAVVTALMTGATNDEAARMAGVSGATVERYKADPHFRENMSNLASETLLFVSERLIALSLRAMDVLEAIIEDDENRTTDRLKAIELVFNNLEKAKSLSSSVSDRVGMGFDEVEVEVTSTKKDVPPSKVEFFKNGWSKETIVFFDEENISD